jgi:dihydrofolate reductase
MQGGTTFHFVTGGFAAALEQARAAAGDVDIAGGASVVQQALTANAIDELTLNIIPVVLGTGERLFTGVHDPGLEPIQVIHSRHATHIRYRLAADPSDRYGYSVLLPDSDAWNAKPPIAAGPRAKSQSSAYHSA